MRSFAEYGKLSKQRIDELEEGVRVDNEPGKADPLDFAVWKAAKPGEPAWESPWGRGRPGWHIECSAMGLRYLGAGFDVHGGGRDLIFPHHENEIAQSEAAGLPFARVWMHNGMIRSEGEKMAKSVGNIFLLREVLDRYEPAVVLTYFLTTHYRSPLEFSTEKLDEAQAAYGRLRDALGDIDFRVANAARAALGGECPDLTLRAEAARLAFAEHMDDDLNTAGAMGELFALVSETYRYLSEVDRGETPLDTEALRTVRDVLTESLGLLLIPSPPAAAEITAAGTVAGDAALGCVTGDVALLPAARLAGDGRWDDIALVYADRLACADPSTPASCATTTGPRSVGRRRPAARRDAGGRLRGARHASGYAGRQEAVSRTAATPTGATPAAYGVRGEVAVAVEWIYGRNVVQLALAAGARRRAHRLAATPPALKALRPAIPPGLAVETVDTHALDELTGSRDHQGAALAGRRVRLRGRGRRAGRRDRRGAGRSERPAQSRRRGAQRAGRRSRRSRGAEAPLGLGDAGCRQGVGRDYRASPRRPGDQRGELPQGGEGRRLVGLWGGRRGASSYLDLDLTGRLVLVFGAEGRGLRPLVARTCDALASIPVERPVESLNVSVAAALFLFEARRQRTAAGRRSVCSPGGRPRGGR